MVVKSALLICPICGGMEPAVEISIIDITIGGETEQYYHCGDCGFEWQVNPSALTEPPAS